MTQTVIGQDTEPHSAPSGLVLFIFRVVWKKVEEVFAEPEPWFSC